MRRIGKTFRRTPTGRRRDLYGLLSVILGISVIKAISGGMLNRTGMMLVPSPAVTNIVLPSS
jgi:hypothetical protein